MSDSGFTSFPPGPPPAGRDGGKRPSSEPNVRLITVPENVRVELRVRRGSIRVQGEVAGRNDDGSVRIRTERGDIDVRVREGHPPPERGARVEIDIQPGRADTRHTERPAEAATLRELPRREAQEAPQRSTATPVDVEVRAQGDTAPRVRQPLPSAVRQAVEAARSLPPEGAVVRLQPLPAHAAQALAATDIFQQVFSTITEPLAFQAYIISQQAVSDIGQAAVNTQTQTPQILTSPAIPAPAIPPVFDGPVFTPSITQPLDSRAFATAGTSGPAEISQAPQGQASTLLTEVQTPKAELPPARAAVLGIRPASIIAQPLAASPAPLARELPVSAVALKPQPLDVVIGKISPPEVRIVPGGENAPAIMPPKGENLILQNQNAGSLRGVVTNITNETLPVLSVFFPQIGAEQVFTLQFPSENITIGTQIQFTPQAGPPGAQTQTAAAAQPQEVPLPAFLTPQPWPALDEVLQTLARVAPQASQALVNVTPSPSSPAQLGPAVLFFVAALRGGDLSQWLGDKATDVLKAQKGGRAISRFLSEGAHFGRAASETAAQEWRAMSIPLYRDGEMHKIGLYTKHEYEDGESDEPGILKSTRFVFDLSLERMGKVQLDGLFKPGRLDLAVRTQEAFSQAMREEMRRIYAKALKDTQITGELSFQGQNAGWVTIQAGRINALGMSA
ncbi:MAG: hypothetical protein R3E13_10260 [Alphaproteobacteria bacterium]